MGDEAETHRRKSRLGAILLTDIVESTRARVRLGSLYAQLLDTHDTLVGATIAANQPLMLADTGDGFEACFGSTLDALDTATEIQWAIDTHNNTAPPTQRFHIRIALTVGEIVWLDQKPTGMAFNEAARIEDGIAGGDEIWCTDGFRRMVAEHRSLPFDKRTEIDFRGLTDSSVLWRVDWRSSPPLPLPSPIPASVAAPPELLAGRRNELNQIGRHWRTLGDRSPAMLVLEGQPGAGKTALARAFAEELVDEAWILHGRCHEQLPIPFGPFSEALTEFANLTNGGRQFIGPQAARLQYIAPEIAPWYPDLVEPPTGPMIGDQRYDLFEAVGAWLAELARQRPTVMLIDDLHLADEATLALLEHLTRKSMADALMIIATARAFKHDHSADYRARLPALQASQHIDWFQVRGLDLAGVQELAAARLGSRHATLSLAGELCSFTGGNPLYVLGVLDEFDNSGRARHPTAPSGKTIASISTPTSAIEVFQSRARRLDPNTRRFLDAAAVMGPGFDPAIAGAATGLIDDEIDRALDELERASLVTRANAGWQFAHAVVREAALAAAGSAVDALHIEIANEIQARPNAEEHAAELSHHYSFSDDPAMIRAAADYAVVAAEQAMTALAPARASSLYELALAQFDRLPEGIKADHRGKLLSALGHALRQAGRPGAESVLLEAAQLAQSIGDTTLMAKTALATCTGFWAVTGAVDDDKLEVLQHALDLTTPDNVGTRALLMAGMASELNFDTDPTRRENLITSAEYLARRMHAESPSAGSKRLLATVLEARCTTLMDADGLEERQAVLADLEALTGDLSPARGFPAASYGCWTALESGDLDAAKAYLRRMSAITDQTPRPAQQAIALHWQSSVAMTTGRVDEAVELAERSYEIHRSIGTPDAVVFNIGLLYIERWMRGTLHTLVPDLSECCRVSSRIGMRAGWAHAQAASGAHLDAVETLDSIDLELFARPVAHQDQVSALVLITLAANELDDHERLDRTYDLLARHQDCYVFNGTASFGSVHLYLGIAATRLERYSTAEKHFVEATNHNRRLAAPCLLAETHLQWATLLRRRWQPKDSVRFNSLLDNALTVAHDLGLTDLEHRCHTLGAM